MTANTRLFPFLREGVATTKPCPVGTAPHARPGEVGTGKGPRFPLRLLSPLIFLLLPACDALVQTEYPVTYSTDVTVLQSGGDKEYGPELFPLSPGDQWLYLAQQATSYTKVTDQTREVNATDVTLLRTTAQGAMVDAWIRVDDDAVWDYGTAEQLNACSIPRLYFPVRVGRHWELSCSDGDLRSAAVVETVEQVGTGMGLFDAVRIRYTIERPSRNSIEWQVWWFVPGIGPVRKQQNDGLWLLRWYEVKGWDAERAGATAAPR